MRSKRHLWILLALTILGAVLRFSFINRPQIWGDESATWSRVCGSYQQMLDTIRNAGFTPTHYQLTWWLGQGMPYEATELYEPKEALNDPDAPITPYKIDYRKSDVDGIEPTARLIDPKITLTPLMMRLVPILCGIAMVPAMYALTVQLAGRRAALYAACFTACSAYLLVYSRDAKMYMQFWLFVALNVAALLWWLRTRDRKFSEPWSLIAFPAWLASGVAMLAYNFAGAGVLGIELLIVLTARKKLLEDLIRLPTALIDATLLPITFIAEKIFKRRLSFGFLGAPWLESFRLPITSAIIPFIIGAAIMLTGPLVYYYDFNQFTEEVVNERRNTVSVDEAGIGWVSFYNRDRTGIDYPLYTASAFLFSWEWVQPEELADVEPTTLKRLRLATQILIAIVIVGLLINGRAFSIWIDDFFRRLILTGKEPKPREPIEFVSGRTLLWLSIWLTLPAYAFYYASVDDPSTPLEIVRAIFVRGEIDAPFDRANINWLTSGIALGSLLIMLFTPGASLGARLLRVAQTIALLAFVILLSILIAEIASHVVDPMVQREKRSVWMPRYLGFVWPAVGVVVGIALARLPTKLLRLTALLFVIGINLTNFNARLFAGTEPPTDRMARDVLTLDAEPNTQLVTRLTRGRGAPGTGALFSMPGQYYLALYTGDDVDPIQIRRFQYINQFDINQIDNRNRDSPREMVLRFMGDSKVDRVILWLETGERRAFETPEDPIESGIPSGWKLESSSISPIFDHWTWRRINTMRRLEWRRVSAPS